MKVKVWCEDCGGSGDCAWTDCDTCKGKGYILKTLYTQDLLPLSQFAEYCGVSQLDIFKALENGKVYREFISRLFDINHSLNLNYYKQHRGSNGN